MSYTKLIERLRGFTAKLRTTSMPIADVAPALSEAADAIEWLRTENEVLKAALSQLDATACTDRHLTELSQDTAKRLMSEVEALKADAGRYKWLRYNQLHFNLPAVTVAMLVADVTELDAAIDAARSK